MLRNVTIESQLSMLLHENVEEAKKRERETYDIIVPSFAKKTVLCGAGGLGRKVLSGLRSFNMEVSAFSDNNSSLWGNSIDGVPIISPDQAALEYGKTAVFIITIWNGQIPDTMAQRCQQYSDL